MKFANFLESLLHHSKSSLPLKFARALFVQTGSIADHLKCLQRFRRGPVIQIKQKILREDLEQCRLQRLRHFLPRIEFCVKWKLHSILLRKSKQHVNSMADPRFAVSAPAMTNKTEWSWWCGLDAAPTVTLFR